jgi:hypothetical protein
LAPGGTLTCTYSANLPDASSRTNTATATLQNYSYDYLVNGTPTGTTDFSASCAVDFSQATINHVDESINVSDGYAGALGTVCYPNVPKGFTYRRNIGPYNVCGDYTVENPASFETNDTHTAGSDSWTINVHVPCPGGCTLTFGYWKTHSKYGPAPYDDNWANVRPNGEDSPFFLSGKTWYQVLWTSPGNACNKFVPGAQSPSGVSVNNGYYILAHQYIGAELNILNGAASTPAVDAAITWATQFFNIYTPSSTLSKTMRQQVISYASLLDQYNNGLIGPGHCSEDGTSPPKVGESGEDDQFGETGSPMPDAYALAQNYPNPFNPSTAFSFDLPKTTEVTFKIYNITGQKVATVFSGVLDAGHHTFIWEAPTNLASGVYFYKLETEEFTTVKKMSFLK